LLIIYSASGKQTYRNLSLAIHDFSRVSDVSSQDNIALHEFDVAEGDVLVVLSDKFSPAGYPLSISVFFIAKLI